MVIERPIIGFTGWEGGPRGKLSRGAWIAIGASAAVHVAGAVYLYNLHTAPPRIDTPPEPPALIVDTFRFPQTPPKAAPTPPNVVRLHPPADPIPTTTATLKYPPQPAAPHPAELQGPPAIVTDLVKSTPDAASIASQPPSKTIRNPTWLARPSPEQLARFYPSSALEDGVNGQAILDCLVTASGQLTRCAISGETPPGRHFGEAALKASRIFRMSPKTEDGQPVEGGTVHIPIHFAVTN